MNPTARTGFTLDTKVADALSRRPELRQILPAFHPAFGKLTHPVLGKVLPKLVNIQQAARVAGVDADSLLAVFNLPGAPAAAPAPAARRMDPDAPWLATAPTIEIDVRPIIDRGEEPFGALMAALREVPDGGVLRITAPFEPAPLLDLVGRRGWFDHVTWDGDACIASLWRPAGVLDTDERQVSLAERLDGDVLDVRGLEPPQPLQLVLAAVQQQLPLTVLHFRTPALLFPRLDAMGLSWSVEHEGDLVRVHIVRLVR